VIIGLNVANWYLRKERLDEGMRLLRRTIEIAFATNQPHQAGAAQIVMARAHRDAGDLDAALAAIRDGARLLEPAPGKQTNLASYALALVTQGEVLGEDNAISLGRPREAAEYFERGYKIAADIAQKDANDARSRFSLSSNGIRLAAVLRHWDPVRAIAIYNEVLRAMAEVKNNPRARRDEIRAFAGSTFPLRKLGRYAEARQQLDAAFSRLNDLELYPADKVEPGSEPDDTLRALAEYEADRNAPRGIEIYQELLQRLMASELVPESKLQHALSLSNLYDLMSPRYRRSGQAEKAAELDTRRMELWRHWDRKLPGNSFVGRQRDASR
jgi:tetratricopeptide (TPR) repeat protein